MITRAFRIPLLHKAYAGNVNDSTQFRSICVELAKRHQGLSKNCENLTLVFDKGNNSEEGLLLAQIEKVHFVGSLVPSHHPELLAVPLTEYSAVAGEQWPGLRAHRTRCEAMGQEWETVVTFSESFYSQQLHGWATQLSKATAKLENLNKELARSKGRRTKDSVTDRVQEILAPLPFREVITVDVREHDGKLSIKYQTDTKAFQQFVDRRGGKTIIFTDRDSWSTEEIIAAYRGQSEIESSFRLMKADEYLHWQPMFHWTDSKIRVHAFYCVVALLLVSLLRKRLYDAGVELTAEQILNALMDYEEITIFYPERNGSQPTRTTYSKLKPNQKAIADALGLQRWQQKQG